MGRTGQRPRVALVCGTGNPEQDAIVQYSLRLAAALSASSAVDACVLGQVSAGRWRDLHATGHRSPTALAGFDAYLLQYNPFSFGRWGVAPWLPMVWRQLHRAASPRSVLTVHETFMPLGGVRWSAMSVWQRAQLWALLQSTDRIIATCRVRADNVCAVGANRGRLHHVPVGSNLDDVDERDKDALRAQLRGPNQRSIIATFGNAHPAQLLRPLRLALGALSKVLGDYIFLNLGAQPGEIVAPDGFETLTPGRLSARELATHLACADLVLLPYTQGALTNKTTLMSVLQLGLPVLSTRSPVTDEVLADSDLRLVDVNDAEGYAKAAVRLMGDPDARAELGRRGRVLYERSFSWDVIAHKTLSVLRIPFAADPPGVGRPFPDGERVSS